MFTLDEAKEAVKNKPEFGVYERPFGTVIDYNLTMFGTFVGDTPEQTLILKNLRGTCFNHAGEIIRLSYDKFHNLNECDGWRDEEIDFTRPHNVLMKLDGSMVTPIPLDDGTWALGTRAGLTDVAAKAENFLFSQSEDVIKSYTDFIDFCLDNSSTPIFEYCARDQRIVIDYPESKLILTAIRTWDGEYISWDYVVNLAIHFDIPYVAEILNECSTLPELAASVKGWMVDEGVVVAFEDGFRVKLKADDYCLKHRALDGLRFEKDVLKLIMIGGLDDVLPIVDEDMRARLCAYRDSVLKNIQVQEDIVHSLYNNNCSKYETRREYAEWAKAQEPYTRFLFNLVSGKDDGILKMVESACSSQTNVDAVRGFIGQTYYNF